MLKQQQTSSSSSTPRKNAMREKVAAVRSRLMNSSELSREQIELALLYYELNIDETVEAFKTNGARDALSGWTEMNTGRGNTATKRTGGANNNTTTKSRNRNSKPTQQSPSTQVPPSNGILRPSQRVSNIFQTFAEGGVPTITTNAENMTTTTSAYSPSSMSSSSFADHVSSISSSTTNTTNLHSQTQSNDLLLFHPYLSRDSSTNDSQPLLNVVELNSNEFFDASDVTTHKDEEIHHDDDTTTNVRNIKPRRRKSTRNRNGSTSSNTEQQQNQATDPNVPLNVPSVTTVPTKPSTFSNNRKALAKSTKDLQRQTSTLSNVQNSFDNEMKYSLKRIDDIFKQLHEILQAREIELYLEMDKVKEQGLNIIHRRQQRAVELRARIDRCDRLESLEMDHLRTDIKQFVTDRRYDLGEELTSSHRFEYDESIVELLKNFGHVLRIDRKTDRTRTISSSSALPTSEIHTTESNHHDTNSNEKQNQSTTNGRTPLMSSSSNDQSALVNDISHDETDKQQQPLPPRNNNNNATENRSQQSNGGKQNGHSQGWTTGDYHQNYYGMVPSSQQQQQTNGHYQYSNHEQMMQHQYHQELPYDDNYHTVNRRRPPYPPQRNGPFRGPVPAQFNNGNSAQRNNTNGGSRRNAQGPRRGGKQTNGTGPSHDYSETTNTYRRPRPAPPPPSNVPVQQQPISN